MNKLLLICLEAKNPKTEKDFFKSIVDKNKKMIAIQYLDQEKINSKSLSNNKVMKLNQMLCGIDNNDYEIICFCDGDMDEKQLKSIKNTYELIIKFFSSKNIKIFSKEFLYDEGYSFEFFIWHITEKYDPKFFNNNKNNIKTIKSKYKKDLVEIYQKYDEKIKNINDVKKNSVIIWKPIIDHWLNNNFDNKDHIEITKKILYKFNNQESQNSKYFKILEKIIERHEFIEKTLLGYKNSDLNIEE